MRRLLLGTALLVAGADDAAAQASKLPCGFVANELQADQEAATLVVRLENPPRTRVVLSVDEATTGLHRELVWDPTVGDGLQHDLVVQKGKYKLTAFADDDRIQTSQVIMLTTTRFTTAGSTSTANTRAGTVTMTSTQKSVAVKSIGAKEDLVLSGEKETPTLQLSCNTDRIGIGALRLNTKKLAAASVVRGFLDQAVPQAVDDTLTLLAEIAIDRAKAGALELVRERFVTPICTKLNLQLLGLGSVKERAFPRTCALLMNVQLGDVLASGRSLVEAARDDVVFTLLPKLIAETNLHQSARDLAMVGLELGTQMLAGGGADSAELDLLINQLDRLFLRGATASIEPIKHMFVAGMSEEERTHLFKRVVTKLLPDDPGALISQYTTKTDAQIKLAKELQLDALAACRRSLDTPTKFVAADREKCVGALAEKLSQTTDSSKRAAALLSKTGDEIFDEWLDKRVFEDPKALGLATAVSSEVAPLACAVRVSLAIVKWCSGRDACSATDIATVFDRPETLFGPDANDVNDSVCWKADGTLRLPAVRTKYVELASRALGFLQPPPKGEERKRVAALLRWTFDLAKTIEDRNGTSKLAKLEEIFEQFAKGDYVRGLAQTMELATEVRKCQSSDCSMPKELEKATKLLGSVASYVQVYEDTKSLDAAEAKAARKKAIETLIDGSTDRKERAGNVIYGLGAPIGFSGSTRWAPGTSTTAYKSTQDAYDLDEKFTFGFRFPLALVRQTMPKENKSCGWHLALTFADLGNFLRSKADADDEVRWKDFLQVGLQAGFLIGNGRHSAILAIDASWSPGLYERDVQITEDNVTRTERISGAFSVGLTLAYYVPFFDFN